MRYSAAHEYSICLSKTFVTELDGLKQIDPDGAATVLAFLQEARLNQKTLETMSCEGFVSYEAISYEIDAWSAAVQQRMNLWRLKFLACDTALQNYRLIYAFHPIQQRYYVLSLIPRSFNYELEHPMSKRIIDTYLTLSIPNC